MIPSRIATWLAIASATAMAACSAATVDDRTSRLSRSDLNQMQTEIRYLDLNVSPVPFTAAELGDTSEAIPVQVRQHEDYLVAWRVVDGVARVGDRDMVVFAWLPSHITPTVGELDTDNPGSVEEPETPDAPAPGEYEAPGLLEAGGTDVPIQDVTRPILEVNWIDDFTQEWMTFWAFHPGCV